MKLEARERLAKMLKKHRGNTPYRSYCKNFGVSYTTVQNWENMGEVDHKYLPAIAKTLGYTLQEFWEILDQGELQNPTPLDKLISQVETLAPQDAYKVAQVAIRRLSEASINYPVKIA